MKKPEVTPPERPRGKVVTDTHSGAIIPKPDCWSPPGECDYRAEAERCYELLVAGIDPRVKLSPAAYDRMVESMRGATLSTHFKMAANTIAAQSEQIEAMGKTRDELGAAADQHEHESKVQAGTVTLLKAQLVTLQSAVKKMHHGLPGESYFDDLDEHERAAVDLAIDGVPK